MRRRAVCTAPTPPEMIRGALTLLAYGAVIALGVLAWMSALYVAMQTVAGPQ